MKTKINKVGDTVVISMDGKLDFEAQEPFRQDMSKLVKQTKTDSTAKKIIFNLENLEFVGSSGISAFVQTLKDFNSRAATKPRYCNVKSEFRRVMKAFDEEDLFEFHDNEERAKKSFDQ
jgi:anti-anti-sigma factor